jgi:hypothetical protein
LRALDPNSEIPLLGLPDDARHGGGVLLHEFDFGEGRGVLVAVEGEEVRGDLVLNKKLEEVLAELELLGEGIGRELEGG